MQLLFSVQPKDENKRLNLFLREQDVTAGMIKAVKYEGGGFFADGVSVHTNQAVHAGQTISFALPPERDTTVTPQQVPFSVVFEDDFAAVLDKPAGIAVHPTLNYADGTLANGWLWHLRQQGREGIFRPVNRIDKNTSGLVLCAQNAFAAPRLAKEVQKCYLAIAEGELPIDETAQNAPWHTINAPIGRRGDSIIGRCVAPDGKQSITEYKVLGSGGGVSLIGCLPVTGRTHQIRVHLSWMGHPLCGDTLYGGSAERIDRHALHCAAIRFCHPWSREQIYTESPLPEDMQRVLQEANIDCTAIMRQVKGFLEEKSAPTIGEGETLEFQSD